MRSILNLGAVIVSAAVLTSCGEAFQAKFLGEGKVLQNSCDGQSNGPYTIEVKAQVAGDSVEIVFLRILAVNGSTDTVGTKLLAIQGGIGMALENDTHFYVDYQEFENIDDTTVSASGNISQTRDEITNLSVTLDTVTSGGSPCKISMTAEVLKIKER